jgi:hypothetical protein
MTRYVRICLAMDLLLLAIERTFTASHDFLPLGGEHFTQVSILLCLAVAAWELARIRSAKSTP